MRWKVAAGMANSVKPDQGDLGRESDLAHLGLHCLPRPVCPKTGNKMICAPSEDSDQPGHLSSLIRVFAVGMKKPWVLSYPLSRQRKLWTDWADAQAGLSLCWAHRSFCWLIWRGSFIWVCFQESLALSAAPSIVRMWWAIDTRFQSESTNTGSSLNQQILGTSLNQHVPGSSLNQQILVPVWINKYLVPVWINKYLVLVWINKYLVPVWINKYLVPVWINKYLVLVWINKYWFQSESTTSWFQSESTNAWFPCLNQQMPGSSLNQQVPGSSPSSFNLNRMSSASMT